MGDGGETVETASSTGLREGPILLRILPFFQDIRTGSASRTPFYGDSSTRRALASIEFPTAGLCCSRSP